MTNSLVIRDVYTVLMESVKGLPAASLEEAFLCWVWPTQPLGYNSKVPEAFNPANYSHVAQLGYLNANNDVISEEHKNLLKEGFQRLKNRPVQSMGLYSPFIADSVALLGIALGTKHVVSELKIEIREWMSAFAEQASSQLPQWKRVVTSYALSIAGSENRLLPNNEESSDIRIALALAIGSIVEKRDSEIALTALCKGVIQGSDIEAPLASIRLRALDWLISASAVAISQPSIEDVISLLEGLPSGLKRWTWEQKARTQNSSVQKWDVQNEYHVQNMLYFLLAPIFPDLEEEFYGEPVAQKNPRADLGIPSLGLIIEVKFVRPGKRFADIVEEIAADSNLYFGRESEYRNRYKHLLTFIWDDSRRTEEYSLLKRGLNQFHNTVGAVIIPRPGTMDNNT